MMANEMSPEQTVENWDLPLRAIYEVIRYCEIIGLPLEAGNNGSAQS